MCLVMLKQLENLKRGIINSVTQESFKCILDKNTAVNTERSGNKTDWSLWCYITTCEILNNNYKCNSATKVRRGETKYLTWHFNSH